MPLDLLTGSLPRPEVTKAPTVASIEHRRRFLGKVRARHTEGLNLFRPLPQAEPVHACGTQWRLVIGPNRSSKTLTAAVEACRAFTGTDPYDKYVKTGGFGLVVGLDDDHLAELYRKISEPGAYKTIPDEQTGLRRAVRPDPENPTCLDPYDLAYAEKWRDSAPLIPPRMLDGPVAMKSVAKGVPRLIRLTNGWRVLWRSSKGTSPQGDHIDFGWIDEQIVNVSFYTELCRGMMSLHEVGGFPKAIWSATPQAMHPQLVRLLRMAKAGDPDYTRFVLRIEDNAYITPGAIERFAKGLTEEDRLVRIAGVDRMGANRIYPAYDPQGIHGCEPFTIPSDYALYVVIDPGTTHLGTLLAAIDPSQKHVWVYDAWDLRQADPDTWAGQMAERQKRHGRPFHAYIMDACCGRQRPPGMAQSVAAAYWKSLNDAGALPVVQGTMSGFLPGSDDVKGREDHLKRWMHPRAFGTWTGLPVLQVFRGCSPELDEQIELATIDPATGKRVGQRAGLRADLVTTLEYLAAHDPQYHRPGAIVRTGGQVACSVVAALAEKRRRNKLVKRRKRRNGRSRN